MNKKIFTTIVLSLILIGLLTGCFQKNKDNNKNSDGETIEPTVTNIVDPLLWEIQTEPASYLFGTIHLRFENVLTLPDVVVEALNQSDVVYTEIKLDQETKMYASNLSMISEENTTLDDLLPQDTADRLYSYLRDLGLNEISINILKSYKIWAIATSLSTLEHELEYYMNPTVDEYIWSLAISYQKETNSLETADEQIDIFDTLSLEEQILLLNDTLDYLYADSSDESNPINQTYNAYLTGDLETLEELILTDYDENNPLDQKIMSRLITNRNINMSNRIVDIIENNPSKSFFFAVGAGHYYGEGGLISLLEEEGLTIEEVPFETCSSCEDNEINIDNRCYIPYQ